MTDLPYPGLTERHLLTHRTCAHRTCAHRTWAHRAWTHRSWRARKSVAPGEPARLPSAHGLLPERGPSCPPPCGRGGRGGWHPLPDEWAGRIVADAAVCPGELVLDIGASHGALTAKLV